jgi:DNA-directed RNA polymerase specialized sigma24 family protein
VKDEAQLWEHLRAVSDRGEVAWGPLLIALEPELSRIARRQPIGRLREHADTPREVMTRVLERLRAHEFAAIKKLCARDPLPPLTAWLRLLVRRAAVDYLRSTPEFVRGDATREPRWISLSTLRSDADGPTPDSLAEKRRDVVRFLTEAVEQGEAERREHGDAAVGRLATEWCIQRIHVRRLLDRGQQYLQVLSAVFEGHSYPEIAARLGITRREVELTVRYIEELLREREFR